MAGRTIEFRNMFLRSDNRVSLSLIAVLGWIAACDGEITAKEEEALRAIASNHKNGLEEVEAVLAIAREGRIADLQLACEVLAALEGDHRRLLLQMAVGVALEDGLLVTPENHLLRFLADLVGLRAEGLNGVFREMTGHPFPEPGDASRAEWWEAREAELRRRQDAGRGRQQDHGGSSAGPALDLDRLRDLAILGLDETATTDDIRQAYRRMAKVHHPDRYFSLGTEAVKAAENTFKRIKAAYERLAET
jgi:DnaJ like chaperone protein